MCVTITGQPALLPFRAAAAAAAAVCVHGPETDLIRKLFSNFELLIGRVWTAAITAFDLAIG